MPLTSLTLPGAERYVAAVARNVESGQSVLVRLPAFAPDGLVDAVRDAAAREWRDLDPALGDPEIAATLCARFDPDAPAGAPRSAKSVATRQRFHGLAFRVRAREREQAECWLRFANDVAAAGRTVDDSDRPSFMIVVEGALAELQVPASLAIAEHAWDGVLAVSDVEALATRFIQGGVPDILVRRTLAAVIARVARTDLDLVARLGRQSQEVMLDPVGLLVQVAAERGWGDGEATPERAWADGRQGRFEGEERPRAHSALLAVRQDAAALRHRLWSGQVGVLFPFVEDLRLALLSVFRNRIELPHRTGDGTFVTIPEDLELTHLRFQLRRSERADDPPFLFAALDDLVAIRNALAHFEPVPLRLLASSDVRRLASYLAQRSDGA